MPKHKDKRAKEKSYDIGYGKPPRHTQFKKGQSGNPSGRPKGTRNLQDDLADELGELIRVREAGIEKTMSKQRAMLKGLSAAALTGNMRAAKLVLELRLKASADEENHDEDAPLTRNELELLEILEAHVMARGGPVESVGLEEAPNAAAVISPASREVGGATPDAITNAESCDE